MKRPEKWEFESRKGAHLRTTLLDSGRLSLRPQMAEHSIVGTAGVPLAYTTNVTGPETLVALHGKG